MSDSTTIFALTTRSGLHAAPVDMQRLVGSRLRVSWHKKSTHFYPTPIGGACVRWWPVASLRATQRYVWSRMISGSRTDTVNVYRLTRNRHARPAEAGYTIWWSHFPDGGMFG
jgi:hypothetical protein